ncbi:hypothetical protein [Haloferula sp. BvORR071]|uniref:hypothetical protein n=1 Tax=Haloferula sp. BvORR071 TaxID=1396141 RepID=UPI002241005E|nr:hypothetical protein [Haloferula sp. BvORR071]
MIKTAPEPVAGVLHTFRKIPDLNATLYCSFLVHPLSAGTGTDSIEFRLGSDTSTWGRIAFRPDQQGSKLLAGAYKANGSGGGVVPSLSPGQTYLIVVQVIRLSSTTAQFAFWVNPPAAFPGGWAGSVSAAVGSTEKISSFGFSTSSDDTGGPASSVLVDRLRVGYVWSDVVDPSPVPKVVPQLNIERAMSIQWQSAQGVSYQPKYSYDQITWFDLGAPVSGDGTLKTVFDTVYSAPRRFYKVEFE